MTHAWIDAMPDSSDRLVVPCILALLLAVALLAPIPAGVAGADEADPPTPVPPSPAAPSPAGPPFLPEPEWASDDYALLVYAFEGTCNTYVLVCAATRTCVVVDPSPQAIDRIRGLVAAGVVPEAIWITHEHGDHVAGLGLAAEAWKVPVLAHEKARDAIARLRAGWGTAVGLPPPPVVPDRRVADGDPVKVGSVEGRAMHVPGHSEGSIAYVLTGRVLVAGDVLFEGTIGRTAPADEATFGRSLARLWDLPDALRVLPGHGRATTIGAEKAANWLFQDLVRAARGEPPIPRPWLGVSIDPQGVQGGVRVTEVVPGGPAATAGVRAGDVLRAIDGEALSDAGALRPILQRHKVGDVLKVRLEREGTAHELSLTLTERPTGR